MTEIAPAATPYERAEIVQKLGDAREVARQMVIFENNARALDARYEVLLAENPGRWVGLHGGCEFLADDLPALISLLDSHGIRKAAAVRHLDPNPLPLIV